MNLLGEGEGEVVPLLVATLFVRRDGIMDLSFYAIVLQVLLQAVALLAENGEDMPHAVSIIALGDTDEWILYLINI